MFSRKILLVSAALSSSLLFAVEDVDSIVAKHVAAMGGADKIRAIKSNKVTGKMVMNGGQIEAPMVAWSRKPNESRMEIDYQGQKVVQAFDGATSWVVNPLTGSNQPQKGSPDESRAAAENTDPDGSPLINYKAKGTTVELQGQEDVAGSMAYKLKITLKSGTSRTMFIDEKTFLPSKMIARRKQMGQDVEMEVYPSNYKVVAGVQMPFVTEVKVGGKSMMQTVLEKVETNVPVDDRMFAFPAAPAPRSQP